MLLKHQLPASVAIVILLVISLATGTLLLHAIRSVDFAASAQASNLQ